VQAVTDLFSTLYHWARQQEENFTTDAFVFVLNHLLTHEDLLGRNFVDWICFGESSSDSLGTAPITVTTQFHDEDGRPDIRIETPLCFILMEVKKASGLHEGQLSQYHAILTKSPKPTKRLVLLTNYQATYENEEKPHRELRWCDVADWMKRHSPATEVGRFLYAQLLLFLRKEMMTVEHVGCEYLSGMEAFENLKVMLQKALELAKIPGVRSQGTNEYSGYNLDRNQFWTGLFHDSADMIRFQIIAKTFDKTRLREYGGKIDDTIPTFFFRLTDSFFAEASDCQLRKLTDFLLATYNNARACVSKSRS
jgi:hypothetical protein